MKLSDYVIEFIARQGVAHVFELIGGAITHLVDSTVGRNDIRCVSVHHEQAGAFAAEAYARMNGTLGVAMATSGPGALNLLTGIGSCFFDSVPCLFVTGQVNTYEYKFDRPVRQVGFQETDIVSVARPLTKYAVLVTDPRTIRYHLEKAVALARGGRPGPVLLDIPMDVQRAQIDPDALGGFFDSEECAALRQAAACSDQEQIGRAIALIAAARRPVLLAGGGIRASGAAEELRRFVGRTGIPVVVSLMGLDAIPHDDPAFCGMIGAYGDRYSNLAIANCDLLLVLGSRLDTRQTGTRPSTFARGAVKIQVDIDAAELGSKIPVDLAIRCDVGQFLASMGARVGNRATQDLMPWYAIIRGYRQRYPSLPPAAADGDIDPNRFMEVLSAQCGADDVICLDVGQNQMWAAQSFSVKEGQRLLTSGGMGSMGFAVPAALGAALVAPGRRVVVITGDGGLQINIQDLDTIVKLGLPVTVVVLNNGCLGMVRQFQDMYFGGRQQSTVIGYGCPDFVRIAEAYGLPGYAITTAGSAPEIIRRALSAAGPSLINVRLPRTSNVNPKLEFNHPVEDMSPYLGRDTLAREMLIDLADDADDPA